MEGGGFALAIVTAAVGIWKAHVDRREAIAQSKKDLLWRQTVEAQNAIRRMVCNPLAQNAMTMLDWNGRKYLLPNGDRQRITWQEMRSALRIINLHFQPMETFVRNSFDALFDEYQMIQQQIDNGMFILDHIQYPVGYYAIRMKHDANREVFEAYLSKYDFSRAFRLVNETYEKAHTHQDDNVDSVSQDISLAELEKEEVESVE